MNKLSNIKNELPVEKLYLQTDKPYYIIGDTIRFKAYLFNADYLTPSTRSGLLYVQLDNTSNRSLKQIVVPVNAGTSWGNIPIDEVDVPEGSYTLRAYTNWMQNFGEDYVFKKSIYITANNSNSTLVNAGFKLDSTVQNNKVQATLHFENLNNTPIMLKDMEVRLYNGSIPKTKYKVLTDIEGNVKVSFDVPDKIAIKNLSVKAHRTAKGEDTTTLSIPVILNRPEKMDLQFMPEGGYLVEGLKTKVGFKAINEDGKGLAIKGKIVNSHHQEKLAFEDLYKGIGSFDLTPEAGESYFADVTLPNGNIKSYPLPIISKTGTVLNVVSQGADSLTITLSATSGLAPQYYYLIAQARGVVCYAEPFNFEMPVVKRVLPKLLFPTGIVRFTILNSANQPVNERVVYVNLKDDLHISIKPTQPNYSIRDSVALAIQVNDKNGLPVKGTFSLAITDDSQVKSDCTVSNIVNNILFSSDLKGTVEEPGYYFIGKDKSAALDNLLLTQGWVGYDWKQVFNITRPIPKYRAENEFVVQGKVTNIFNKPVKQTKVSLFRKTPLLFMEMLTDNNGRFTFRDTDLLTVDSAYFLVQAKNRNGNAMNVGVEVDEFLPQTFAPLKQQQLPWYVNTDNVVLNNNKTKLAQVNAEESTLGKGYKLKEVTIKTTKTVKGSQNPEPETNDAVWDEKEMFAAKKMTLLEMLQKKYKTVSTLGNPNNPAYVIDGHYLLWLFIDGLLGTPFDLYVNYLTAEDIRGIEIRYIITAGKYDILKMHVTTYSGAGKFLKHEVGTYAYKPIPFSSQKEFYRPRYTIKNSTIALGTDMRSTIHWEPNVVTDKDGKAIVSFYSADKPTSYLVLVEGTDFNGKVGKGEGKIIIAAKQQSP